MSNTNDDPIQYIIGLEKEMVKARILKSALKNEDAKNVASKIAQQTSSTLIDIRGHTFILYKRRKKKSEKSI